MKMNPSATIMELDAQNNIWLQSTSTFQMGSKCNPSLVVCQPSGPADHFLGSVTQHPSITLKGASCGPAPPTGTVYQAIKVTTMKTNMWNICYGREEQCPGQVYQISWTQWRTKEGGGGEVKDDVTRTQYTWASLSCHHTHTHVDVVFW